MTGNIEKLARAQGEIFKRLHQAGARQTDGVQPPCEISRQRDSIFDQLNHLRRGVGLRRILRLQILNQSLTGQRGAGEVLAEAVVNVVTKAALLSLADV